MRLHRRQGHYHQTWYTHVVCYLWKLKISISRYITHGEPWNDGYHFGIEWNESEDRGGNPVLQWTFYPHLKDHP